jgi:DNA polymerase III epsilon subunit family exonuclease
MNKTLEEVEFTIFDTETTGLEPNSGDRVVEIAAIRLKGREKVSTFHSLVNPQRPISEAAFAVNKITADMLKDAPTINEVMPEFLKFIQGSCPCSYNANFDVEFINNELKLIGQDALKDIAFVDILKMARRLMPGLERYALWFVADKLGIKTPQQHRALSDVELTLGVFEKLKDMLKAKNAYDFNNFSALFSIDPILSANLNNQKIAEIQQAIDLKVKLKIKYLSRANAEVSEREVIPKEIRQDRNTSYLVGFCCLRNEERTFRIDGILHLEII